MTTNTDKASDKLVEMALKEIFEKGWCAAAQWAQRDDLRHDTGSIAYAGQRDAILAGKAAEVHAAIIADLCWDVEPVAWIYWHPSDTSYDGPDTLHKKAVSRFTDDTRKAMLAKGWLFEPLYPATVAALKAENEALRAALQGLVDFHTKPAGVTVELISEKDLFSQAMADIDAREKKLVADAIAAIAARRKT